jgi:tetratricopeptide (TPR) repeat protein
VSSVNLRKEHVVLGGTLALLALLHFTNSQPARATSSRSKAAAPSFESFVAPKTELALPRRRALDDFDRDVFSQPTDTRPLPPLQLEMPPLPRLSALRPPPSPTLAARLYGKLLRADATPTPVAGLFFSAQDAGEDEAELEELSGGLGSSTLDLLQAAANAGEKQVRNESPEEREARIASYKKLYDWLRLSETELLFGQIRNEKRLSLKLKGFTAEPIEFVQVDPDTGREKFPGQKPVPYQRDRVAEFALADTPSNGIGLRFAELDGPMGPVKYGAMLSLADDCIELRLEAREALTVAEGLYRQAAEYDKQDPTPQLGLARCYEAGFRFDDAYTVYNTLVESFGHRPEVHVSLAELEARLRLFESARERFQYAEDNGGRANWRVQRAYGRFLFERGEFEAALARLRVAYENEPREPSEARTRAAIRRDLGAALLAVGAVDEAAATYEKALQAEPDEPRSLAGRLQAQRMGASAAKAGGTGLDSAFDLLLARALIELEARNWQAARDALAVAAGADPLRAPEAWRALSWLAEITGNGDDALRWIERAREGDPTDAWVLYQHGRLLAARDDAVGAREAFVAALDREIDFADALVALGELSLREADYASAERYFERALALDPQRAEVHALRALNLLAQGDSDAAKDAADAALAIDALHPVALASQAWHTYRSGDSQKAITQYAELNDARRSLPESDPFRVYAKAQMERIAEHEAKFQWSDGFERLQLKNGWTTDEAAGPLMGLSEGALRIDGAFTQGGTVRVYQEYNPAEFVSLELDVTIAPDCNAKVGVFVAKERRSGAGGVQTQSKIGIARRRDGGLVVLLMDTATADENWEDVPSQGAAWWPTGRPVRLRIERVGEGNQSTGRLLIDGVPVREGFKIPKTAAPSGADVKVGVFVEGQTGLPAKVSVDNVDIIRRVKR